MACKAQTTGVFWTSGGCEQCTVGEGICDVVDGITTAWDWLTQLNAVGFAGYSDWRLPSSGGCGTNDCSTPTGEPEEIESILLNPYPCGTNPCINPIFGPTGGGYRSNSTVIQDPGKGWEVNLFDGGIVNNSKRNGLKVRAVR